MTKNIVKLFSDTLFVFYGQNFVRNECNIKLALILPNDDTKSGTNFILTFNHIARYALAAKIKFMLHKNSKILIA